MKIMGKSILVPLPFLALLWLATGCSDDTCTPHTTTRCENNVTYWVDSCGHREEPYEACQYGCSADGTRCEGNSCTPNCTGKECGPDGCGGFCSPGCSGGKMCDLANGQCECASHTATQCTNDKTYYLDSCGNLEALKEDCTCGCSDSGLECKKCDCTPTCEDAWTCGDDGCGGTCGAGCDTGGGEVCNKVSHECECTSKASYACHNGNVWWFDSCGNPEVTKQACDSGCEGQECTGCTPDCTNKQCGEDGCGGECGTGCPDNQVCHPETFQCVCVSHHHPACYDTDGDDATDAVWWFDSCGNPEEMRQDCGDAGCLNATCLDCTPDCTGKECGPDGCGGECSPGCANGEVCNEGTGICFCSPHASSACFNGDIYWYDSCNHQEELKEECGLGGCETTPTGPACKATCEPQCTGKACGPDGCDGTCAPGCSGGAVCNEATGQCVCTPNASTACHTDGNVHYFDSCGIVGDIASDCQGNGCDEATDTCNSCAATCEDWECGPDSCGEENACGTCTWGNYCSADRLCVCDADNTCDHDHICAPIEGCVVPDCTTSCGPVYARYYQFTFETLKMDFKKPNGDTWDAASAFVNPDPMICLFKAYTRYPDTSDSDTADVVWCSEAKEDVDPNVPIYINQETTQKVEMLEHWVVVAFDEDLWIDDKIGEFDLGQPVPIDLLKQGMSDEGLAITNQQSIQKLIVHIDPLPY